uniref:reticulocalbin-2-like n=1 Tax=Styela clava TaxID=7725 RepID=UPI00193939B7|nr:reticulocalbin-2-like [Styela clava]
MAGLHLVILFVSLITIQATVTKREDNHDEFVNKVKESHIKDGEHNVDFDRDVIWGDEKNDIDDDDAVENMSPLEQKEKLRKLVENRIDTDKDGYVSIDELVAWAVRSYDLFETEDTRNSFSGIDTNNDKFIQWSEYALDSYGDDFNEDSPDFINPPSDEWSDFVATYKKERRKFEVADLDQSGGLDLQEFQYFKHPRLHEKTRDIVIEEVLDSSDLNGDGAIDLEEFLGDYQKKADEGDPEWAVFEKEKFQHEFDTNKDGLLKGEEIVLWMAPDNSILAREEAEHLMEESDSDHDDKLSVEEILNNYVDWVDSDATDYGRQLLKHHEEL